MQHPDFDALERAVADETETLALLELVRRCGFEPTDAFVLGALFSGAVLELYVLQAAHGPLEDAELLARLMRIVQARITAHRSIRDTHTI